MDFDKISLNEIVTQTLKSIDLGKTLIDFFR
jgi:hypothetical protein